MSRYPHLRVRLRTPNSLALVAAVRHELRRAGIDADEIEKFTAQAMEIDDPDRARAVCGEWVDAEAGRSGRSDLS